MAKVHAPAVDKAEVISSLSVSYGEYHQGTFNGCAETLSLAIENFLKEKLRTLYPNVILDRRTMLGRILNFLRGGPQLLYFHDEHGNEYHSHKQLPGSIFTKEAGEMLFDLNSKRNNHVHKNDSLYLLVATFQHILIPTEHGHIIFNPVENVRHTMEFDEFGIIDPASFTLCVRFTPLTTATPPDVEHCEQGFADLILECLTKLKFDREYGRSATEKYTHVLVILYGKRKFFVYMKQKGNTLLRKLFGEQERDWRTHYYRFLAPSLLGRFLANDRVVFGSSKTKS